MGQYSSVVWVSDDTDGDRQLWFDSPNLTYLLAGGNLMFMSRRAQNFLTEPLREYLGIEWLTMSTNLLGAHARHAGLTNIGRIGSQSYSATFVPDQLGPETTLLYVDPNYGDDMGVGAWRTAMDGGEFAFLSGRPYRWDRDDLSENADFILRHLFGEGSATAMGEATSGHSHRLWLGECVPNPMNPSARIPFELAAGGPTSIKIYDVSGRLVRDLLDETLPAGRQSVIWDGRAASGREVGSGIYYIRLQSSAGTAARAVTLLR